MTVYLVYGAKLNIQARDASEIFFGLDASKSADVNFLVLPFFVVLATALMASLAMPLGPLLRSMPPLRAYAIDIGGSMLGIAGFTVLAYLGTGPTAWFVVDGGLLVLMLALGAGPTPWSVARRDGDGRRHRLERRGRCDEQETSRSRTTDLGVPRATGPRPRPTLPTDAAGYLLVDGIPHQAIAGSPSKRRRVSSTSRVMPGSRTGVFERVLIIGAGSGTDTGLALAKGAKHVDAVEIDPKLAQIGRDFHPDGAYLDPRVTVHVNDGRAFLNNSNEKYDLVVYTLTDSG